MFTTLSLYISYSVVVVQVSIGVLLTSGRLISTKDVCVIRELQPQTTTEGGLPLLTEFDCPILLLTSNLYIVPSYTIHAPVSVVHACSDSCQFNYSDSLIYVHDISNNLFCYNIYCIGNN